MFVINDFRYIIDIVYGVICDWFEEILFGKIIKFFVCFFNSKNIFV